MSIFSFTPDLLRYLIVHYVAPDDYSNLLCTHRFFHLNEKDHYKKIWQRFIQQKFDEPLLARTRKLDGYKKVTSHFIKTHFNFYGDHVRLKCFDDSKRKYRSSCNRCQNVSGYYVDPELYNCCPDCPYKTFKAFFKHYHKITKSLDERTKHYQWYRSLMKPMDIRHFRSQNIIFL